MIPGGNAEPTAAASWSATFRKIRSPYTRCWYGRSFFPYDEVLERSSAERLRDAGLAGRYEDRDYCVDFPLGASRAGEVLLGGVWWRPVKPSIVASRALFGTLRARCGQVFAERLTAATAVRELEETELLSGAELPPAHVPVAPLWPRPASI